MNSTDTTHTTLTRVEWTRRFAARIVEVCGWDEARAAAGAEASAEQNFENNGDEWLDPEDEADVEISYMEHDITLMVEAFPAGEPEPAV